MFLFYILLLLYAMYNSIQSVQAIFFEAQTYNNPFLYFNVQFLPLYFGGRLILCPSGTLLYKGEKKISITFAKVKSVSLFSKSLRITNPYPLCIFTCDASIHFP
jgi:hypothetical protein